MAVAPLLIVAGSVVAQVGLSYLMRPKLPPVDKGKLDDIRITGSDLGTFIPRILCGKARLAGNIFFSNGIQHYVVDTPSSGGKGAPSAPATRTHIYQTTLGILICRDPIYKINRIWADTDLLTNGGGGVVVSTQNLEAESATLSGGASSFPDASASGGFAVNNLGSGGKANFTIPTLPPPFPAPNYVPKTKLSLFCKTAVSRTAKVTLTSDDDEIEAEFDFVGSPNWQAATQHFDGHFSAFEVYNDVALAPDLDKIGVYWYWMREDVLAEPFYQITGNVNPNIDYPKNLNDPSEFYNYEPVKDVATGETSLTPAPAFSLRTYTGTETQTPDAAEVAWLEQIFGTGQGALRASAHRGLVCTFLENVTLKQGRVQNYTFEADKDDDGSVQGAVELLLSDVGLTEDDWDTDALEDYSVIGFLEHQQTSRKNLIDHLQLYFQFRRCEIDGKIKFISENQGSGYIVDNQDLRAHSEGEEMPQFDAEVIIKEEHLLPREVRVSFMNPDLDYHNEAVTAQVFGSISSTESKEYTFPIIDTDENAREKAEILLLKEHSEDKAVEIWAMPAMARLAPGDVITLNLEGTDYNLRIERKQMEMPVGKIRFQCVPVEIAIWGTPVKKVNEAEARDATLLANTNFPRNSVIFVIPSLSIFEADNGRLGVYLAISGRGRGNWENCAVYREYDEDNYILQFIVDSPSPLGICRTALAAHPTNPDVSTEDTTSELIIDFFDDIELESVTQDDLDRYPKLNLMRVGNEWIQFRTATAEVLPDNSPYRSSWKIENLWRERFSSIGNASHDADEYAALVTPALRFFELEDEDINETINLKAVTNGQSVEVAPVASFTFELLSRWTIANATTPVRNFDARNVTKDELADAIATLAEDLRY